MPDVSTLSFVWPSMLWLLLVIPLVVVAIALRRLPGRNDWVGMIAIGFILVGLTALLAAVARPQLQLNLPSRADRLMVVLDISGSMRADDAEPSRIDGASKIIQRLINEQPASMRIGLVTAAATATLAQQPTTDRDALRTASSQVSLQEGSALGSGILIALAELVPSAGIKVQELLNTSLSADPGDFKQAREINPAAIRAPGSNRSVAMVLISDGEANMGVDPLRMAELAADLGVRIHTIGIGTQKGAVVRAQGISQRVRLQPELLQDISRTTLGYYFEGANNADLEQIFESVQASIEFERTQLLEISAILTAMGMMLLLLGAASNLARAGRIL